jgi:cytochrome P450
MAYFSVITACVLALFVYLAKVCFISHTLNSVLTKLKTIWGGYSSPIFRIPGPWYSRYTKLVLGYHILTGRRMFYIDNLHQKYGGVVRITPTEVAIADMAGVTQIHKIGSGFLKSSFYDLLVPSASETPGLFAMRDPRAHGIRRKFFARPFSNTNLKSHWGQEIRRKAELAVQKIREEASGARDGADILKWWTLMATDVIAHISFGESFHMIETGKVSLTPENRYRGKAKHPPENSVHRRAPERGAGCSAAF